MISPKKTKRSRLWTATITTAAGSLLSMNMTGLFLMNKDIPEPKVVVPPTPREYLAMRCEEEGCDFALLDTIIFCESTWRMVKNSHSSAFGYFQIIDSTERGTPQYAAGRRKFDPYANIDMGVYLYSRYGTSPWNESKGCWQWRYQSKIVTVVTE